MDALHKLSLDLLTSILSLNEKNIAETLETYKVFLKDFPDLIHTKINNLKTLTISPYLKQIGVLLQIKFNIYVVKKGLQEMKEVDFASILKEISNHNIHKVTVKGQVYKCDFHIESLLAHLILAMLTTMAYLPEALADAPKVSTDVPEVSTDVPEVSTDVPVEEIKEEEKKLSKHVLYGFTALLHDIGKYSCVGILNIKDKKWTQFPFHGEMGSGIIQQAYNDEFAKLISKAEWEYIARTICVHMCGYHEHNPHLAQTKYKWSLLQLESSNVKEMLSILSVADHFAGIKKRGEVHEVDYKSFIESRDTFKKSITSSTFDIKEFMKTNTLQGTILMMCGMSCSGKSTLTTKIVSALNKFGITTCIIERDDVLCKCVAKFLKEPIPAGKVTGETYLRYRKVYEEKKLSNVVNKTMSSEIDKELKTGKFVILDTVMNIFKGIETATPESIKKAFKIAIHVIRDQLITEEDGKRLGISLSKQLEIHGDKTEFAWLPQSIIGENHFGGRLKQLTSISTASDVFGCRDKMRPHLVHTATWKLGHDELIRQLLILGGTEMKIESGATNEMIMNICEYVNHLYKQYGFDRMKSMITTNGFLLKSYAEFDNKMIKIKYIDGCQYWKAKWARQCRGVFLFLNSNDKFICIKYQLQRGAEICKEVSNMPYYELLDDVQQDTVQKIINNDPLNGYLSFKSDGCLLGISLFKKGTEICNEILKYIKNHGDEFAKSVNKIAIEMNLPFVPVIGSQNTLFVGEDIHSYVMTAIASSNGFSNEEIKKMAELKKPNEVFEDIGHLLLTNVLNFYNATHDSLKSNIMTLSFEAVCKNRTCAWNNIHKELAISYQSSFIKFLGCTYCLGEEKNEMGEFKAHFQLEKELSVTNWNEPIWWKITSATQIEEMLQDLSKCLDQKGDMDEKKFFTKYKPYNSMLLQDLIIDYEGFVFYRDVGKGRLDYSKIKTLIYYKTHKFHTDDLAFIMNLSPHIEAIFPNAKLIKNFFKELPTQLKFACNDIIEVCLKPKEENKLFSGLPEKAKTSFDKHNISVKMKMFINSSPEWKDICYNIFVKYFTYLPNEENTHCLLKSIIMSLSPCEDDLDKRIIEMTTDYKKNELTKELLICLIGKKNMA
ncbi:MAG: hypothetical protein Edafosvirus18_19 [Edafosvirus sp.]|uniref:HD domain-containing protein n=1 Tax=Edafosvirus sp. TaxID=2487765 RepID=A0A3G4ZUI5_9VIRU|nr:MAG: hypothetical protein Edafosvirus18_19 [Edafosvirus sp.]